MYLYLANVRTKDYPEALRCSTVVPVHGIEVKTSPEVVNASPVFACTCREASLAGMTALFMSTFPYAQSSIARAVTPVALEAALADVTAAMNKVGRTSGTAGDCQKHLSDSHAATKVPFG